MLLGIPLRSVLILSGLVGALALIWTKPSSGMRSVVLTLLIGTAMLAGLSLAVFSIVHAISYEESWGFY